MAKSQSPINVLQATFDLTQTESRDMWRSHRDRWKKSRLYLTVNPDEQKNAIDMFFERYNSPKIGLTLQIKRALIQELNNKFLIDSSKPCSEEDISLRWDKFAGCSCPCSPGYVITFNNCVKVPYQITRGGNFRVTVKI
jgi:hypothetical protein